jgi:hypothetical protein
MNSIKKIKAILDTKYQKRATFGTDPNEPWSVRAGITEGRKGILDKYLSSRGINPKFISKYTRISHAKSTEFQQWKRDHMFEEVGVNEGVDKKDTVVLDIPLLIRVLELAREDIKTDMDLHRVVEKLISIRNKGVLTMDDYDTIAKINENHIAIAMGNMLDDEGSMVLSQLEQLERAITMIRSYVGKDYEKQLPAWVQAKITLATDYADTVGNYITSKNEKVTEEVKKSKPTALERFRKSAAEREKKHNQTPTGDMKGAIDRLEKHMNKEEVPWIVENELQDMSSKHGWELNRKTYGAELNHPKHGKISIDRYGEWHHHKDDKSGGAKAHGEYETLGKHLSSLKEEVEQIDELKKSTVFSWLKQQPVVPEKKPGMSRKDHNQKIKSHSKSWNRALDRLAGYKPTSEDVFQDTQAATQTAFDMGTQADDREPTYSKKKEMSKSARMIKSLYKKNKMVKEDLYDHEKEDKSVATYGKKPKLDKAEVEVGGEDKAAMVLSGGKTLTGQKRDTLEIDPMMRKPVNPQIDTEKTNNKKTDK